ncbi:MAG: hypothetical protein PHH04_05510 [Thomasclavelia sp.]|nr:hypothetical protein [Thomasclavelia sp.]
MEQRQKPIGLMIISFIMALVGIILYFVKRKQDEYVAKCCLYSALAGMVFSFVINLIQRFVL